MLITRYMVTLFYLECNVFGSFAQTKSPTKVGRKISRCVKFNENKIQRPIQVAFELGMERLQMQVHV